MKKYSKDNVKKRGIGKLIIFLFIIFAIFSIALFLYVLLNNNVVYEKIDDSAKQVSDDEAQNATPIIVDNVLLRRRI